MRNRKQRVIVKKRCRTRAGIFQIKSEDYKYAAKVLLAGLQGSGIVVFVMQPLFG